MSDSCLFCNIPAKYTDFELNESFEITCPSCGTYVTTYEATSILSQHILKKPLTPRQIANISGWLFENQDHIISPNNWKSLLQIKTPSFHERADKILLGMEKRTDHIGQAIQKSKDWDRFGWCLNGDELQEFLVFLQSTKRISSCPTTHITIKFLPMDGLI